MKQNLYIKSANDYFFNGYQFMKYGIKYLPLFKEKNEIDKKNVDFIFIVRSEFDLFIIKELLESLNGSKKYVLISNNKKLKNVDYYFDDFEYKNRNLATIFFNKDNDINYIMNFIYNRYFNIMETFNPKYFITLHFPSVDYAISSMTAKQKRIKSIGISHSPLTTDVEVQGRYLLTDYHLLFSKYSYQNVLKGDKNNYISKPLFVKIPKSDILKKFDKKIKKDFNMVLLLSQFTPEIQYKTNPMYKAQKKLFAFVKKNKSFTFLIQPHPRENKKELKKRFRLFKNVIIINQLTPKIFKKYKPAISLSFYSSALFEYGYLGIIPIAYNLKKSHKLYKDIYDIDVFGELSKGVIKVTSDYQLKQKLKKISKNSKKFEKSFFEVSKSLVEEKSIKEVIWEII